MDPALGWLQSKELAAILAYATTPLYSQLDQPAHRHYNSGGRESVTKTNNKQNELQLVLTR
jgi:hypothetical protein